MQGKNHFELYQEFIEFVSTDIQRERHLVNRRMLSVFMWCFFLPAITSAIILLLIKTGVFPRFLRNYLDWFILILPILYSLYILGSEVLTQVPSVLLRGKIAISLSQAVKESEWRKSIIESMSTGVNATEDEWDWLIASFRMDLQSMQNRTRFLTALAGAVFFLLMQGIDSLAEGEDKIILSKTAFLDWITNSSNYLSQFVGLTLFLVLLYLSGSQTHQSLHRYLNCAELIRKSLKDAKMTKSSSIIPQART